MILRQLLDDRDDLSDSTLDDYISDKSETRAGHEDSRIGKYGFDERVVRFRHHVKKRLRFHAWVVAAAFKESWANQGPGLDEADTTEDNIIFEINDRCDELERQIKAALTLFPDDLRAEISKELLSLVDDTRDELLREWTDLGLSTVCSDQGEPIESNTREDPNIGLVQDHEKDQAEEEQQRITDSEANQTPEVSSALELESDDPNIKPRNCRWNHSTISKDRTAASDFSQEILSILSGSRREKSKSAILELHDTVATRSPGDQLPKLITSPTSFETPLEIYKRPLPGANYFRSYPLTYTSLQRHLGSWASTTMATNSTSKITPDQAEYDRSPSFDPDSSSILGEHNGTLNQLLEQIRSLKQENQSLKTDQEEGLRYEIIYFIGTERDRSPTAYLDEPTWAIGPRGEVMLKALFPIPDVQGWLDQRPNVAFSVGRFYAPKDQESEILKAVREKKKIPEPKSSQETIRLESQDIREAVEAFFNLNGVPEKRYSKFAGNTPLSAPYLFWYHHRSPTALDGLTEEHRRSMGHLTDWIDEHYGEEYGRVQEQLKRGVVSFDSMVYMIKPGDVVVLNNKPGHDDGIIHGKIAESSPVSITPKALLLDPEGNPWQKKVKSNRKRYSWKWVLPVWQYTYDGSFYRNQTSLNVDMDADELEEEISINRLNIYPLTFATDTVKQRLEQRGRTFWTCRERRLISYEDAKGIYGVSSFRYVP